MRRILATVLSVTVMGGFGCATYLDDLNRAERHYQSNEHERALALFRAIESDMDSLNAADRARYAYLRGINNYRMSGKKEDGDVSSVDKSFRSHARHWLSLAKAMERQTPGSLRPEWKTNLDEALRDLNQDVFGVGVFPEDPADTESGEATARADDGAGEEKKDEGTEDEGTKDDDEEPAPSL